MVEQFQSHLVGIGLKRFQINLIRKKFSVFKVIYHQPTRKTYLIHNNPHGYWRNTLAYNICQTSETYSLSKNVWHLLLVNISSKFFSLIDYLRYPHSSSSPMNTSLGESSKFPRSSTSIPSSFSSAITTFSEGLPSSIKPWFF